MCIVLANNSGCETKRLFSFVFFMNYEERFACTVKLENKELFDKEQIGIKEPFPVTNLPFTS